MNNTLVLAKDIRHQGGYYEFVSLLLDRQRQAGGLEYFRIGRTVGDATVLGKIWSIPTDHFRLAIRLMRASFQCLLFNTSMNASAFVRDALLVMLATKLFKRRIVIQVHGWQDAFAEAMGQRRLLRILFDRSFRKADCIIVLAERFKDQLMQLGIAANRIRVGTSMFDGKMFENRQRSRIQGRWRLLFLSRLTKEKGAHQVLAAFREIHERYPDTELIMAGDGPDRAALEAAAQTSGLSSEIRFPGYVRGTDKAELLLTSDIFLLPTAYGEGMPISMLEAMAAGMPVVVTRAGAISELLVDGEHGTILESNAPEEISKAVEGLLADPGQLDKMGERNRSFAWSRFEADLVSRNIVALCRASSVETE